MRNKKCGEYIVTKNSVFGTDVVESFSSEADANAYAHEMSERFTSLQFIVYKKATSYLVNK